MELHQNEKKFCDVLSASLSGQKEVALQFGSIEPLDSNPVINLLVPKLPVVGMGTKFELVEGDHRIEIDVKQGFELEKGCILQAVVLKRAK